MPTDPKGRTEVGYQTHVFVCGHERNENATRPSCANRNSLDLLRHLKLLVKSSDMANIRVQKSGCLDFCEFGTTCVVYPEGTWYSLEDEKSVEDIFRSLKEGTIANEHLLEIES
jgi:(2Fe-2S) ferredoxin